MSEDSETEFEGEVRAMIYERLGIKEWTEEIDDETAKEIAAIVFYLKLKKSRAQKKSVEAVSLHSAEDGPLKVFPDKRPCCTVTHEKTFESEEVAAAADLSLECCEGDPDAPNILFIADGALDAEVATHLENTGDFIQTTSIPVNHGHILWNYVLRVTRVEDEKHTISLLNVGTHLDLDTTHKFGISDNDIENLRKPQVLAAQIMFRDKNMNKMKFELVSDDNGLKVDKLFTTEQLQELTSGNSLLSFRLKLIIARSYFQLSSITSLNGAPATTAKSQAILDTILRGERPPGYDWAITVAESEDRTTYFVHKTASAGPTTYYVHKAAFASVSTKFKLALEGSTMHEDRIQMVPGENRCIFPQMTAHDMKVLIPLVYGLPAPLPEKWILVSKMGQNIDRIIDEESFMPVVFPQWERAIVQQAIALDKHSEDSFPAIFSLLMIVWSAPYGAMPIAKRVCIAVLADMIHLQYDKEEEKWFETICTNKELSVFLLTAHIFENILTSVCNHLLFVHRVQKIGCAEKELEWEEEVEAVNEPLSAPPPTPSRHYLFACCSGVDRT